MFTPVDNRACPLLVALSSWFSPLTLQVSALCHHLLQLVLPFSLADADPPQLVEGINEIWEIVDRPPNQDQPKVQFVSWLKDLPLF